MQRSVATRNFPKKSNILVFLCLFLECQNKPETFRKCPDYPTFLNRELQGCHACLASSRSPSPPPPPVSVCKYFAHFGLGRPRRERESEREREREAIKGQREREREGRREGRMHFALSRAGSTLRKRKTAAAETAPAERSGDTNAPSISKGAFTHSLRIHHVCSLFKVHSKMALLQ